MQYIYGNKKGEFGNKRLRAVVTCIVGRERKERKTHIWKHIEKNIPGKQNWEKQEHSIIFSPLKLLKYQ